MAGIIKDDVDRIRRPSGFGLLCTQRAVSLEIFVRGQDVHRFLRIRTAEVSQT